MGRPPLGVDPGTNLLSSPPRTLLKLNCCSSDATSFRHAAAPLSLPDSPGAARQGWAAAAATLRSWERTAIVTQTDTYLHAECATKTFGWIDDLELHLREGGSGGGGGAPAPSIIAIRSASRSGLLDFGENRRRVEVLRAQLLARGVLAPPDARAAAGFQLSELPILLAMFSSIVGYAMVLPLLPALLDAESLGPTLYGAVNSLGNFVALVAATALGRLSDLHGRRPALLVCAVAGGAGTILLGMRLVLPEAAGRTAQILAVLGVIMRRIDRCG